MNQIKGKAPGLEYDFTGLHNFVRLMDTSGQLVVKVGIFGNKNARGITSTDKAGKAGLRKVLRGTRSTLTNAELGLIHELGSVERGIPKRSFLRMPISEKSKEILADAFKGAVELLAKGDIKGILKRLGIACEKWIQYAFATRGFGSWVPDQQETVRRKGSNAPLIDTAQLRRSIASQVGPK
jgi:hypothetical protein